MFARAKEFIIEVIAEFKRVQYPTREATIKSTWLVLTFSIVIAVYLGVIDLGLSEVVKMVINS